MTDSFTVNKKIIATSYITQFFQYCVNAMVLPLILSMIDSETLGIWYIFISISSLAQLMDFGFSSSLSRNVSYVFSGANKLVKEGCQENNTDRHINYSLLYSLLSTTKQTYFKIACVMALLLLSLGTLYVYHTIHNVNYIPIWFFFALSISINYYYNYILIYIKGRGLIVLSNKLVIISKISYVIVIVTLLLCGFELWALTIANILSAFIARQLGLLYFWDEEIKTEIKRVSHNKPENLFPVIWYNAKRMGITGFTNYAFSQANVMIAGLFLTLSEVAQLGLCMQIFSILLTLSRVNLQTYYPKICSLWISNSISEIKRLFFRCQLTCYLIFITGITILIVTGDNLLRFIHSNTMLPNSIILCLFSFFYFMEITHGNCAILISSNNKVPFYKADIVACITTLCSVILFLNLGYGLYSFPIAMCCGSLPYNSWKWVLECYKLLNPKHSVR